MKSTKDLARELGLLKRRSSLLNSAAGKGLKTVKNPLGQIFQYLIVLDFESTCWEDKTNARFPEIIEFPAVLLDTSSGEIHDEFHRYVQPTENPRLSSFCTHLTGITQKQVDSGIPVGPVLRLFCQWMEEIKLNRKIVFPSEAKECGSASSSNLCTVVTWSDWDLNVCLQYECKRKHLSFPPSLRHWIDLRATYRAFYNRNPRGLNGALQDLGIEFAGRQHSGIDDARNTAMLAWRMIRDGCVMKITKSLGMATLNLDGIASNDMKADILRPPNDVATETVLADSKILIQIPEQTKKSNRPDCHLVTYSNTEYVAAGTLCQPTGPYKVHSGDCVKHADQGTREISHQSSTVVGQQSEAKGQPDDETDETRQTETSPDKRRKKHIISSENKANAIETVACTKQNLGKNEGSCILGEDDILKAPVEWVTPKLPRKLAKLSIPAAAHHKEKISRQERSKIQTPLNAIQNGKQNRGLPKRKGFSSSKVSGIFKTPSPSLSGHKATFAITPPLCNCGRRTKRRTVMNTGPNQGRIFYTCSMKQPNSNIKGPGAKLGCNFFQWEQKSLCNKTRGITTHQTSSNVASSDRTLLKHKYQKIYKT